MSTTKILEKTTYEYSSPDAKYSLAKTPSAALTSDKLSAATFAASIASLIANENCLLYSINVVSPVNIGKAFDPSELPSGLPRAAREQFMTGYFYSEEIEKCSPGDFQQALYAIAKHAQVIEVAARLGKESALKRNRIEISPQ